MNRIMISGPDGTGKSTISTALEIYYKNENINVKSIWLRFNHYFAKLINVVGRITGKSYYENYSWGKAGYHEYHGVIGYFYILAVYFDHIIFRAFFRKKHLEDKCTDILIIDRYILDIMADLIVDTARNKLVLKLFLPFAKKELEMSSAFILKCSPDIVISRRADIKDDKSWMAKRDAYIFLAEKLNIKEIDTGELNIEEIVKIITAT